MTVFEDGVCLGLQGVPFPCSFCVLCSGTCHDCSCRKLPRLLQDSGELSVDVWNGEHVTVLQLDALTQGSASGDVGGVDKSKLGVSLAFGSSTASQCLLWALLRWDLKNK